MTTRDLTRRVVLGRPGLVWVGVVAGAQILAALLKLGPPIQPILPIVFALTVPGFVLLDLEYPADRVARFVLGVAGSLATNVVLVTVLLLGSPIWMIPVGGVALVGLWRFANNARPKVASQVEDVVDEPVSRIQPEPESEEEIYHPPVSVRTELGVSWKRRERLAEVLDERTNRPFEKPIKPIEEERQPEVDLPPPPQPVAEVSEEPAAASTDESPDASPGAAAWRRAHAEPVKQGTAFEAAASAPGPLEQLVSWRGIPTSAREGAPRPSIGETTPSEPKPESFKVSRTPVDLNSADVLLLATLPGVGPRLATRLVEHRDTHGPFRALRDVGLVSGFGPAKVAGLQGNVAFGQTAPAEGPEKETS